jgi:Uma2 family endonuclease
MGGAAMLARQEPRHMTVDEWRDLLRSSDIKYEYRSGWVYAMAGGSLDHSRIKINVIRALEDGLGDRPCLVYDSDAAVRLSPSDYTFPDAVVTCAESDRGSVLEVKTPRVIVEVLSESTEHDDRTAKFELSAACPSVQEYALINTTHQSVEVFRRSEPRWTYQRYGPQETVELESIGVSLSVAQIYWRTDVPEAERPRRLLREDTAPLSS